ncbi:hypothetical protein FOZ63_015227, partial [Perkinsus olseni]
KLEEVGDPARGAWFCPSPSSRDPEGNRLYHWHVFCDASNAAMGAVLAYGLPDGPLTVVRDASWLLDRRALLRHVNVNELCGAARALAWATPFIGGHVHLHVDNECVRAWIEKFMRGEAVKKGGLSATVVGRRLQSIYDVAETYESFTVHRVDTSANLADPLSRVDASFSNLLSYCELGDDEQIDVENDLLNDGAETSPVGCVGIATKLVGDELILDLGTVVEAQYDDDILFKVRRALREGRSFPEDVPVDLQQVATSFEIDDVDILVRRYYAAYQGKEVVVPVLPGQLVAELVHSVHGLLCHAGMR